MYGHKRKIAFCCLLISQYKQLHCCCTNCNIILCAIIDFQLWCTKCLIASFVEWRCLSGEKQNIHHCLYWTLSQYLPWPWLVDNTRQLKSVKKERQIFFLPFIIITFSHPFFWILKYRLRPQFGWILKCPIFEYKACKTLNLVLF